MTYDVLLDDNDPVWRRLRYQDMSEVVARIDELYECMRTRIAARKVEDPDDMDKLRKLMLVLAGDEKTMDTKIAMHRRMQRAVEDRFLTRRLHDIASLEHELVTGVDSAGGKTSASAMEDKAVELLTALAEAKAALKSRIKRGDTTNPDLEKLKPLVASMYVPVRVCAYAACA